MSRKHKKLPRWLAMPNPGSIPFAERKDRIRQKTRHTYRVNYGVKELARFTRRQARIFVRGASHNRLVEYVDLEAAHGILTYPLLERVPFRIKMSKGSWSGLSIGEILWCAAQTYRKIYRSPAKYGVWGHGIGDLCFSDLTVWSDGRVQIGVDS